MGGDMAESVSLIVGLCRLMNWVGCDTDLEVGKDYATIHTQI